eukprot:9727299-Alexandrium_andersonii.AAC.1
MSGEELDLLLTKVDGLIGINPVLRQVASRSSDTGTTSSSTGAMRATRLPPRDASPRGAHEVAWE